MLLQARAHSASSAVLKMLRTAPLSAHLQMSSSAGADNTPTPFLRCSDTEILGITQGKCAKGKDKNLSVPFCAFFISGVWDSSVSASAEKGWTHNILLTCVFLGRDRNKVIGHYWYFIVQALPSVLRLNSLLFLYPQTVKI